MRCENCGYENGQGAYCAECGAASRRRITNPSHIDSNEEARFSTQDGYRDSVIKGGQVAAEGRAKANPLQSLGQNERVQQAAEVSRQYLSFFVKALLRPYQTMRNVQPAHALHSYITMSLISILTALFSMLVLNRVSFGYGTSFMSGFMKPLLFTGITLLVGLAIVYGMTKLYRTKADFKQVAAGYGTLLIPSVASILLANLLFMVHLTNLSLVLMGIAFLIAFVAVNISIFTYPVLQTNHQTVDVTYALIIANLILFYLIYKIVSSIVLSVLGGMMASFL